MKKFLLLLIGLYGVVSCSSSDEENPTVIGLPILSTSINTVTSTSAISGGIITSDEGQAVTARGVVWSTIQNPTISLTTKTVDGVGAGTFTSHIAELASHTTYYVRAYATNSNGTAYGNQVNFLTNNAIFTAGAGLIDIDGNNYPSIIINGDEWMQKNLNVSKYRNGDAIPQITNYAQWLNATSGAWCYYENNSANGSVHGKLYNWYAVNDPRGLAPIGWHVASKTNWISLSNFLGVTAGIKLQETGTSHWEAPNREATNESGFTALASGIRTDGDSDLIQFQYRGNYTAWWSSTYELLPINTPSAWCQSISNSSNELGGNPNSIFTRGFSVRCVKD